MGPIACELYGREERKNNMIGRPTLAQGTTDHEPGMLDNKFAFPGHCAVFVGVQQRLYVKVAVLVFL
jgi:hypothetical protein